MCGNLWLVLRRRFLLRLNLHQMLLLSKCWLEPILLRLPVLLMLLVVGYALLLVLDV